MKKYLFVIPSLSKGGAEKVVSILSNQLIENNKEVVIITHFKTNLDYQVHKKVKVVCLSNLYENEYRKKINIFFLIKLMKKLRKTIKEENPNYIIPFLWTTCIRTELALIFNKNRKKIIHTVRNNPKSFPGNIIARLVRNLFIFFSKKCIVQNIEQKEYFKLTNKKKIYVLNNPISSDILSIKKIEHKNFTIIGVGRLEKQKNFEMLIDAFSEVVKVIPNVKLKIFGVGSLEEKLNMQINRLKLEKKAMLMGRTNDYSEIYGKSDLFVLSSNAEGMPNCLLEAMAVGLPCISTNCPTGPSNIIQNNVNGILINVNDKEKLIENILYLYNSEKDRIRIEKKAKKHIIDNFSSEKITNELIKICENIEK